MSEIKPAPLQPKRPNAFKKFVRWFILILLLVCGLFIYWRYYYTYGTGVQGGKMQKISHKGNVFKTWEGYILISLTTNDNTMLTTKEFPFSVTSDSIAHLLEDYQGKKVRVRYNQKNSTLPWRGDTPYIVYEVELEEK